MNSRLRTFKHSQLALVLVSLFGASTAIEAAPIKVAHADEPEDTQPQVYAPQIDPQDQSESAADQTPATEEDQSAECVQCETKPYPLYLNLLLAAVDLVAGLHSHHRYEPSIDYPKNLVLTKEPGQGYNPLNEEMKSSLPGLSLLGLSSSPLFPSLAVPSLPSTLSGSLPSLPSALPIASSAQSSLTPSIPSLISSQALATSSVEPLLSSATLPLSLLTSGQSNPSQPSSGPSNLLLVPLTSSLDPLLSSSLAPSLAPLTSLGSSLQSSLTPLLNSSSLPSLPLSSPASSLGPSSILPLYESLSSALPSEISSLAPLALPLSSSGIPLASSSLPLWYSLSLPSILPSSSLSLLGPLSLSPLSSSIGLPSLSSALPSLSSSTAPSTLPSASSVTSLQSSTNLGSSLSGPPIGFSLQSSVDPLLSSSSAPLSVPSSSLSSAGPSLILPSYLLTTSLLPLASLSVTPSLLPLMSSGVPLASSSLPLLYSSSLPSILPSSSLSLVGPLSLSPLSSSVGLPLLSSSLPALSSSSIPSALPGFSLGSSLQSLTTLGVQASSAPLGSSLAPSTSLTPSGDPSKPLSSLGYYSLSVPLYASALPLQSSLVAPSMLPLSSSALPLASSNDALVASSSNPIGSSLLPSTSLTPSGDPSKSITSIPLYLSSASVLSILYPLTTSLSAPLVLSSSQPIGSLLSTSLSLATLPIWGPLWSASSLPGLSSLPSSLPGVSSGLPTLLSGLLSQSSGLATPESLGLPLASSSGLASGSIPSSLGTLSSLSGTSLSALPLFSVASSGSIPSSAALSTFPFSLAPSSLVPSIPLLSGSSALPLLPLANSLFGNALRSISLSIPSAAITPLASFLSSLLPSLGLPSLSSAPLTSLLSIPGLSIAVPSSVPLSILISPTISVLLGQELPFLAFGASAGSSISGSLSNIYSLVLPEIALSFAQSISLAIPELASSVFSEAVTFAWFGIWFAGGSPALPFGFLSPTFYFAESTVIGELSSFLASWTLASSIPVGMTGLISSSSAPATLVLVPVGLSSFVGGLSSFSSAALTPITAISTISSAVVALVSQLSLAPILGVSFGLDMISLSTLGIGPSGIAFGLASGVPYIFWGASNATSLGVALSFYLPSSVLSINIPQISSSIVAPLLGSLSSVGGSSLAPLSYPSLLLTSPTTSIAAPYLISIMSSLGAPGFLFLFSSSVGSALISLSPILSSTSVLAPSLAVSSSLGSLSSTSLGVSSALSAFYLLPSLASSSEGLTLVSSSIPLFDAELLSVALSSSLYPSLLSLPSSAGLPSLTLANYLSSSATGLSALSSLLANSFTLSSAGASLASTLSYWVGVSTLGSSVSAETVSSLLPSTLSALTGLVSLVPSGSAAALSASTALFGLPLYLLSSSVVGLPASLVSSSLAPLYIPSSLPIISSALPLVSSAFASLSGLGFLLWNTWGGSLFGAGFEASASAFYYINSYVVALGSFSFPLIPLFPFEFSWISSTSLYIGPSISFYSITSYGAPALSSFAVGAFTSFLSILTSPLSFFSLTPSTFPLAWFTTYLSSSITAALSAQGVILSSLFSISLPINVLLFPIFSSLGSYLGLSDILALFWFPIIPQVLTTIILTSLVTFSAYYLFISGLSTVFILSSNAYSAIGLSLIIPTLSSSLATVPPLSIISTPLLLGLSGIFSASNVSLAPVLSSTTLAISLPASSASFLSWPSLLTPLTSSLSTSALLPGSLSIPVAALINSQISSSLISLSLPSSLLPLTTLSSLLPLSLSTGPLSASSSSFLAGTSSLLLFAGSWVPSSLVLPSILPALSSGLSSGLPSFLSSIPGYLSAPFLTSSFTLPASLSTTWSSGVPSYSLGTSLDSLGLLSLLPFSSNPSLAPLSNLSSNPSLAPSFNPSSSPFSNPSLAPLSNPLLSWSANPLSGPLSNPLTSLSTNPSSTNPISNPSTASLSNPSLNPLSAPFSHPSSAPFSNPSLAPLSNPLSAPFSNPLSAPSSNPLTSLSTNPSSTNPLSNPSTASLSNPSLNPSLAPLSNPSMAPFSNPSSMPLSNPLSAPLSNPSLAPISNPSSGAPLTWSLPSSNPSSAPLSNPSINPLSAPLSNPSLAPFSNPSLMPLSNPSSAPFSNPSLAPISGPLSFLTNPSSQLPSSNPLASISNPSINPSSAPLVNPLSSWLSNPSLVPLVNPLSSSFTNPSLAPFINPLSSSSNPSLWPSSGPLSSLSNPISLSSGPLAPISSIPSISSNPLAWSTISSNAPSIPIASVAGPAMVSKFSGSGNKKASRPSYVVKGYDFKNTKGDFEFRNLVTFGDSLSDTGSAGRGAIYMADGNPMSFYNSYMSIYLTGKMNAPRSQGGTNYAVSGALVKWASSLLQLLGDPLALMRSKMSQQIDQYYADNQGKANAKDVFVLWGGGNDMTGDMMQAAMPWNWSKVLTGTQGYLDNKPRVLASYAGQLARHGAENVFVMGLPDPGLAPFSGSAIVGATVGSMGMFMGGTPLEFLDPGSWVLGAMDSYLRDKSHLVGSPVNNADEYMIDNYARMYHHFLPLIPTSLWRYAIIIPAQLQRNLVNSWNKDLQNTLKDQEGNVIYADIYGLWQEVQNDPFSYGFTNTLVGQCTLGKESTNCDKGDSYYHGDDGEVYMYTDWHHPSPQMNQIIAEYLLSIFNAPGYISSLARTEELNENVRHNFVNNHLKFARFDQREVGEANTFADILGGLDKDSRSLNPRNLSTYGIGLGTTYRAAPGLDLGAALAFTFGDKHPSNQLKYRHNSQSLSLFAQYKDESGLWGNIEGHVSREQMDDIRRSMQFLHKVRTEQGSTKGTVSGGSVTLGYDIPMPSLSEQYCLEWYAAPYISYTYNKYKVDGYTEEGNRSTSMQFKDQSRKSKLASVGVQLSSQSPNLDTNMDIAYVKDIDSEDFATEGRLKHFARGWHRSSRGIGKERKGWLSITPSVEYRVKKNVVLYGNINYNYGNSKTTQLNTAFGIKGSFK